MIKAKNYFRYTLSNRLGVLLVEALDESDFTIQQERTDDGQLDYSSKMPNAITFRGPAFQNLLRVEQSQYRCDFQNLGIEKRCGDTWVPEFSGRMSLNDGVWDLDRCEVAIKMDDVKPDQCFEDNDDVDVNIITGIKYSVYLTGGEMTLEKFTYADTADGEAACAMLREWPAGSTPLDGGWIEYESTRTSDGTGDMKHCSVNAKWARETVTLACGSASPGSEWRIVEDTCPGGGTQKWARPARLYGCKTSQSDYTDPFITFTYTCLIVGDSTNDVVLDNGVALKDVLQLFVDKFCPGITVKSEFFQINPDVVTDINYVTQQRSKTQHIILFQKSDVKRPTASQNALTGTMQWKDLMQDLIFMFNVRWRFEDDDVLRIEHISYYTAALGLNLVQPKYAKYLNGKRKYSYNTPELPGREHFTFMEASGGDFQGYDIIYKDCVTASGKNSIVNYAVDNITTDVELVLGNPDSDSNIVDDEGFVLIACDYDSVNNRFFIITESPILGGNTLNNSVAWAQLHRDYHKWYRPARRGQMNGQDTEFLTVKPLKKGDTITIPLCCGETFNPNDLIQTTLGTGTVDRAVYSFKDQTLELDLLYVADDNLIRNNAPIAHNDVVDAQENTAKVINVVANDEDADPLDIIKKVNILSPPLHGDAVVNPDLTITYTPDTDYVGPDQFTYNIEDTWSQASNTAGVAITVKAPNQPPIARDDFYIANKDSTLTVPAPGIFSNDSDDSGVFYLQYADIDSDLGGSVVVNTNGSFTYDPPAGYVGPDTFLYSIIDIDGLTDSAQVHIDVRDPAVPVANNDLYQTQTGVNLTVAAPGVLANDTNTVGTLTAVAGTFATAQGGSFVLATKGSFTYTPPAGYTGSDSVSYGITNGTDGATGTVNLTVVPIIYAKIQVVNGDTVNAQIMCSGFLQNGGSISHGTVRVSFYSNAGGTVPFDVTGLGLILNVKQNSQSAPGGPIGTSNYTFGPATGIQYDIFTNKTLQQVAKDCAGEIVFYANDFYTLNPGNYVIL